MIIINNFNSFQKQSVQPTFKSTDYFHPIKNSSKMVCGYCGRKTMPIIRYMNAIKSVALPLKVQLEKGVLDYLKNMFPKVWETVNNLSKQYPKNTLDEIIHGKKSVVNENYIALKEAVVEDIDSNEENKKLSPFRKNRYINKIFFDLNDIGRSYMQQSSVVIDRLRPLVPYLNEEKKEIFEQLEGYSRKYPRKTLSEIVQDPEIAEYHRNKNSLHKMEIKEKVNHHFENVLKIVEEENPFAIPKFQDLQKQAITVLYTEKDPQRRRYLLMKMYDEALEKHSCQKIKNNVMEELNHIPESFLTKDYFFVVAADKKHSDGEIVNFLFSSFLASEKHVIPLEEGGPDEIGNKIVMCRSCNTKTKAIPYKEVIKYHPEMLENIQNQMNIVTGELLNGGLSPRLRAYPIYVADNFKKASDNTVKLDIIDYCKEVISRSKKKVSNSEKKISWLKKNQNFDATNITFLNEKEELLQKKMKNFIDENK